MVNLEVDQVLDLLDEQMVNLEVNQTLNLLDGR